MNDGLFRGARRRFTGAAAGVLAAAAVPAAARAATGTAPTPPLVVASFSILADIVREVAPPDVEVVALVGPDADAHAFEPTPADARRLARADLVVVNGLGFEGWIDRLVRVARPRGPVAVASQGVPPRADAAHGVDPHAWHDLAHGRRYAATIAQALAARWPQHGDAVRARSAAYRRRIDELEHRVRGWIDAVPRAERRVITSHDAFGYFGAAYGVDILAPRRWGAQGEPSAAAVAALVRQIRAQRVRALFLENIGDPRLIERIAAESGARVGGTLYADALSRPDGPAPSYLALFEHNARTLATALAP